MSKDFHGGPSFDNWDEISVILEDIQLSITLPKVEIFGKPKSADFPFNRKGWFDRHAKQYKQHYYAPINAFSWDYFSKDKEPKPIGSLRFCIELKRIPEKSSLKANNLGDLSQHVISEYDDFFNSAVEADERDFSGRGFNTQQRRKILHQEQQTHTQEGVAYEIFSDEHKAKLLEFNIFQPLKPAEVVTISDNKWVYFNSYTSIGTDPSVEQIYCLALNESFYLQTRFCSILLDNPELFDQWEKHSKEAKKLIMSGIEIDPIKSD